MATEQGSVNPGQTAVIAVDLGGTKLASCLFAENGVQQLRSVVTLEKRQGAALGELITGEVRRLRGAAVQLGLLVKAVGVSIPGIANPRTGRVWAQNLPGWEDYPLRTEVRAAIADTTVKVVVGDDRTAYILGEAWQGAARGCRDAIFLAVGTGIGAGILADGRVLHGAHGIAGAIGWMALDRTFRPEYGTCGCFESYASGEGLAKELAAALAEWPAYRGPLRVAGGATAHELFQAYEDGDEVARKVLTRAVEYWGMASANLVSLFNPEKIVFGGGVFGPATQFLEAIADEARRWAQPISMGRVTFEASQLGSDAGLFGAGYLAMFGSKMRRSSTNRHVVNE